MVSQVCYCPHLGGRSVFRPFVQSLVQPMAVLNQRTRLPISSFVDVVSG